MATTAAELTAILPSFPTKDLTSFHVESLLGGGGFSHVVLARDAAGAEWALKLIPAPPGVACLADLEAGAPQLLAEARIHLLLSGEPSILPCMEAFKAAYVDEASSGGAVGVSSGGRSAGAGAGGGRATFLAVMRMPVAACSAEEWLFTATPPPASCSSAGGQLDEQEVLGVWLQMVNAVHRCHMHGVVHKDIKLPNFLMDARGRVQLMDFGLAQVEGVSPRAVAGTPWTMSPAGFKHGDDGRAGDWWSLGVVLYQLLQGGSWPFKHCWWPWQRAGGHTTEAAIRRAVLAGRITFRDSPILAAPGCTGGAGGGGAAGAGGRVSEPARALIRGLLQPDPNRRWQLRQVLASEAVRPEILRGIAARFPELKGDMQGLLWMQQRARGVQALGSDGGSGTVERASGGMEAVGSVVAAAAGALLGLAGQHHGTGAGTGGAGSALHWPQLPHWPGAAAAIRLPQLGAGGDGGSSYRPLLGSEGGVDASGKTREEEEEELEEGKAAAAMDSGRKVGSGVQEGHAAAPAPAATKLGRASAAAVPTTAAMDGAAAGNGSGVIGLDDLLLLLPDEENQHPSAPPTPPLTVSTSAISASTGAPAATTATPQRLFQEVEKQQQQPLQQQQQGADVAGSASSSLASALPLSSSRGGHADARANANAVAHAQSPYSHSPHHSIVRHAYTTASLTGAGSGSASGRGREYGISAVAAANPDLLDAAAAAAAAADDASVSASGPLVLRAISGGGMSGCSPRQSPRGSSPCGAHQHQHHHNNHNHHQHPHQLLGRRGSRTSLHDLFGGSHTNLPVVVGGPLQELGSQPLNHHNPHLPPHPPHPHHHQQQQHLLHHAHGHPHGEQHHHRSLSGGGLGGLLGSAVDLLGGGGGGGGGIGGGLRRAVRRSSLLLRAGSGGGGGEDEVADAEPMMPPPSSWVPPPPEALIAAASARERRSLSGGSGTRRLSFGRTAPWVAGVSNAAAVGAGTKAADGGEEGAGLGSMAAAGLAPGAARGLMARVRRLFSACLQRPGVRYDMYDDGSEYDMLPGKVN